MAEHVTVSEARHLEDGDLTVFDVKGVQIAVAKVDGSFYAFDDTCTHLHCSLAQGELEGTVVTCPCHGSEFDVTTGAVLQGPAREPVRSYPVALENDDLQVEI